MKSFNLMILTLLFTLGSISVHEVEAKPARQSVQHVAAKHSKKLKSKMKRNVKKRTRNKLKRLRKAKRMAKKIKRISLR